MSATATPTAPPADIDFTGAMEALEGTVTKIRLVGGDIREGKVVQASDKDGTRRFKVGRHVVSVDTIVAIVGATVPGAPAPEPDEAPADNGGVGEVVPGDTPEERTANHVAAVKAAATKPAAKPAAAPKPPAEKVTLTSGKVVTGKTVRIRCAWVEPDKRTKAQEKIFATNFKDVEPGKGYEAMVKAAGNGKNAADAMPDGSEREIKVQDAFQVRFTVENQKKHRNALRRTKTAAAKAAREAAKA